MLKTNLYLVHFDKYIVNLLFFKLLYSIFVFYKWFTSTKCKFRLSLVHFRFKFISYYKNLLTTSFILYLLLTCEDPKTKEDLIKEFYLEVLLFLNCLIIFHFLLFHTAHFDESIILPVFILATFGSYFLYFFYNSIMFSKLA